MGAWCRLIIYGKNLIRYVYYVMKYFEWIIEKLKNHENVFFLCYIDYFSDIGCELQFRVYVEFNFILNSHQKVNWSKLIFALITICWVLWCYFWLLPIFYFLSALSICIDFSTNKPTNIKTLCQVIIIKISTKIQIL